MTNKEVVSEQQNIQPQTLTSRRIEELTQHPRQGNVQMNNVQWEQQTENTEDPFMSLRILHEQQCAEKQRSEPPRQSTSSHSTLEGAVVGTGTNYPKPQRQNRKQHQNKKYPTKQHEISRIQRKQSMIQQDSHFQGPHNNTTYMNLPNSMQGKICGRCGIMGHIKRQCKEEVYCKFCRNPSHSTAACRTYANFLQSDPVTSSRKNTPEKRTTEDIDREIARRVQQEVK